MSTTYTPPQVIADLTLADLAFDRESYQIPDTRPETVARLIEDLDANQKRGDCQVYLAREAWFEQRDHWSHIPLALPAFLAKFGKVLVLHPDAMTILSHFDQLSRSFKSGAMGPWVANKSNWWTPVDLSNAAVIYKTYWMMVREDSRDERAFEDTFEGATILIIDGLRFHGNSDNHVFRRVKTFMDRLSEYVSSERTAPSHYYGSARHSQVLL